MEQKKSIKSFIIEGNIGAGKSTFLRLIERELPVHIVYEPVDQWQKVGAGENLLERFYSDTKRWAYTFQSYAFITRVIEQQKKREAHQGGVHILERSVYSDRYCFAKNCFEMGTLSELEWQLYKEWFDWLVLNFTPRPTGFIYLQTTPENCYQRLKKRDRSEEKTLPLSYLQKLHDKHEQWLAAPEKNSIHMKDVPVLIVDADVEFEGDAVAMGRIVDQIAQFTDLSCQNGVERSKLTNYAI